LTRVTRITCAEVIINKVRENTVHNMMILIICKLYVLDMLFCVKKISRQLTT
jgi:hypothetical protein